MNEAIKPMNIKFCVHAEFQESRIDLGFIMDASGYVTLTDAQVSTFLSERRKGSTTTVSLEQLDKLLKHKTRTNMGKKIAETRMEDLLTD